MLAALLDWKLDAALGSCLLLGLRHGFDYDHLAAISDITAVEQKWWQGLRLGLTYALGHAFTVAALGFAVIGMNLGLPTTVDHWSEKLIGLTLIALGLGVAIGILRQPEHPHHHGRIESRLAIAINGILWMLWQLRRLVDPSARRPERFRWIYTGRSVFLIGMLHGIGAETPSQLALFFLTANLGGRTQGILGLAAFALGLVTMNGLMTASLGGAFHLSGNHHPRLFNLIAWTGALYSCAIGIVFLFGISDWLPTLGG